MVDFLLYGATGYTGRLIAHQAAAEGLRPLLTGRRGEALAQLGTRLGLPHRAFELTDARALEAALADVPLVLSCAGPFASISAPLVDACLRLGRHYVDISGEVGHTEHLRTRDAEARTAGSVLLPGAGFDLVPTDCLAAHVAVRLGDTGDTADTADTADTFPRVTPSTVIVAVQHLPWLDAAGRRHSPTMSRGTAATLTAGQLGGGLVRRAGRLVPAPLAGAPREMDLGAGPVTTVLFPMAELVAIGHSTGASAVEARLALPASATLLLRRASALLRHIPLSRLLPADGPSFDELERSVALVRAEAVDARGRRTIARLRTPNGYAFTARAAIAAVRRLLASPPLPGFHTPVTALGLDFVLSVDGVSRYND